MTRQYKTHISFMNKSGLIFSTACAIVAMMLMTAGGVFAGPAGGDFEVSASTIDGGGGTSSGGGFSLTGTIGQYDADPQPATGGTYALAGGFWANAESADHVFKSGYE